MDFKDVLGIALAIMFVISLPIIIVVIIWRVTRKIKNGYIRVIIRSVVFTPTVYGHAGIVPAFFMVIIGEGRDRFIYGLVPIIVVLSISMLVYRQWYRSG